MLAPGKRAKMQSSLMSLAQRTPLVSRTSLYEKAPVLSVTVTPIDVDVGAAGMESRLANESHGVFDS